jgi:hypothetical protein
LPFVDPQHGVPHRLVQVGRPEIGRMSKAAIPGMHVLMNNEAPFHELMRQVGEIVGWQIVLTFFRMLNAAVSGRSRAAE